MPKKEDEKEPVVRVADISEFKPDPENVNLHTERGKAIVEKSMRERGYGRPAFSANDGRVLGGNLSTLDVAAALGLKKVIVVETEGEMPIIHVRTDIDPDSYEARRLAIEDNRSAQVSIKYDPELLLALQVQEPELVSGLWDDFEWMDIEVQATTQGPPIVDDGEFARGNTYRGGVNQNMVVVGFGRFAALVDGDLVREVAEKLKERWGDEPGECLTQVCKLLMGEEGESASA